MYSTDVIKSFRDRPDIKDDHLLVYGTKAYDRVRDFLRSDDHPLIFNGLFFGSETLSYHPPLVKGYTNSKSCESLPVHYLRWIEGTCQKPYKLSTKHLISMVLFGYHGNIERPLFPQDLLPSQISRITSAFGFNLTESKPLQTSALNHILYELITGSSNIKVSEIDTIKIFNMVVIAIAVSCSQLHATLELNATDSPVTGDVSFPTQFPIIHNLTILHILRSAYLAFNQPHQDEHLVYVEKYIHMFHRIIAKGSLHVKERLLKTCSKADHRILSKAFSQICRQTDVQIASEVERLKTAKKIPKSDIIKPLKLTESTESQNEFLSIHPDFTHCRLNHAVNHVVSLSPSRILPSSSILPLVQFEYIPRYQLIPDLYYTVTTGSAGFYSSTHEEFCRSEIEVDIQSFIETNRISDTSALFVSATVFRIDQMDRFCDSPYLEVSEIRTARRSLIDFELTLERVGPNIWHIPSPQAKFYLKITGVADISCVLRLEISQKVTSNAWIIEFTDRVTIPHDHMYDFLFDSNPPKGPFYQYLRYYNGKDMFIPTRSLKCTHLCGCLKEFNCSPADKMCRFCDKEVDYGELIVDGYLKSLIEESDRSSTAYVIPNDALKVL